MQRHNANSSLVYLLYYIYLGQIVWKPHVIFIHFHVPDRSGVYRQYSFSGAAVYTEGRLQIHCQQVAVAACQQCYSV